MGSELHYLTIAEAARHPEPASSLRSSSPTRCSSAEALEPQLNAFITVTGDLPRGRQRSAE